MNSKERFLAACACMPVDRTPIWLMRQAGRYLPEYRAMKAKYSFLQMVKTPELATEVTLMPLRRFDLDAAILFSDILVIPEALGQPYAFRQSGGIVMDFAIDTPDKIDLLDPFNLSEKLSYVSIALKSIRRSIGNTKALLGFCGSPWTLAAYMLEGHSGTASLPSKFECIQLFAQNYPIQLNQLMQLLSQALIEYVHLQIESGVDAIQIFDSWGSLCSDADYWNLSLQWIQTIIAALPQDFPVILFSKGMSHHAEDLLKTGASVLSLDWTTPLSRIRQTVPGDYALQGNLDPTILNFTKEKVEKATLDILEDMSPYKGHIFNLGHGIMPQAKIENVETLIQTLQAFHLCQKSPS